MVNDVSPSRKPNYRDEKENVMNQRFGFYLKGDYSLMQEMGCHKGG